MRGFSRGFEARPPHASLSVSLLQRGRVPPANARKTAFKKSLLFLIPAPSFAEETGVCFQAHVPREQKVRAALRTKHLEPKGMARGENTVTARERGAFGIAVVVSKNILRFVFNGGFCLFASGIGLRCCSVSGSTESDFDHDIVFL